MTDISDKMVKNLAESYGYTGVDKDAARKVNKVAVGIVENAAQNVDKVTKVCKVKTAKPEHFELVSFIQKTVIKESGMKGGKIVLPAEYHTGEQSGQYLQKSEVQPMEAVVSAVDPMFITRPAMPIKVMGGGREAELFVSQVVKKMRDDKKISCTVSPEGKEVIAKSLKENMKLLFSNMRKHSPKSKSLNAKSVDTIVKKHPLFSQLA